MSRPPPLCRSSGGREEMFTQLETASRGRAFDVCSVWHSREGKNAPEEGVEGRRRRK